MEFDFLPEFDERFQALLATDIPKWQAEVKALLPDLPGITTVSFDNEYLVEGKGAGGFAPSTTSIVLSFDLGYRGERKEQFAFLRGCFFHEAFHTAQGFVGEERSKGLPAMYYAIYEGAATKFEMQHAGVTPEWGNYPDEQTMQKWITEVKKLPPGYDWRKWQITGKDGHKWILFQVGTYIVDRALKKHTEVPITAFASKKPEAVLSLADLPAQVDVSAKK